MDDDNIIL